MNICPTCKRKLPVARTNGNGNKKLLEDMKRAMHAIETLERALTWPNEPQSFRVAVVDELSRMKHAMQNPEILWSIYRRADKATGYEVSA